MEMAVELEDELFFADLSKQIALLIMDDDGPVLRQPSVSFQGFTLANYPVPVPVPVPQSPVLKGESKGTGVFIPKASHQTRRKNRQGRFSSSWSSKTNRQIHYRTTMASSQASFSNICHPGRG